MPSPKVKYVLSASEIPAGQNYVLVRYGEKYEEAKHPLGLTITVAQQKSKTVSDFLFDDGSDCQADRQARGIFRDFCLQIIPTVRVRTLHQRTSAPKDLNVF